MVADPKEHGARDAGKELPGPPDSAEDILAQYVFRSESDDPLDFEEVCRKHPELESQLRDMFRQQQLVDSLLEPDSAHEAYGQAYEGLVLDRAGATQNGPSRYEIVGDIAVGGMGSIVQVHDSNLDRMLAMKRIRAKGPVETDLDLGNMRVLRRFLDEAHITGQLVHPGIVSVHELGVDSEGQAYFTMQLVNGRHFGEVIDLARENREDWSLRRALTVLVKVCQAMAYAHSEGVIHRDLKPANIMVGRFGETYVMDWGLARVLDQEDSSDLRIRRRQPAESPNADQGSASPPDSQGMDPLLTMDGDVVGTPFYMSPEQARGDVRLLDARSDVYTLGAMLYHLLTGHPPYAGASGANHEDVLGWLRDEPPVGVAEASPEAPRELAAICDKAMARNREDRYQSAEELEKDLEAFLGTRPVSPVEHTLPYLLNLAIRRNKRLFAVLSGAAVVVMALVALDLFRVRNARDRTAKLLHFASAELLAADVGTLFPPVPSRVAELEAWLEEADDLVDRLEVYRGELSSLPAEDRGVDAARLRDGVASLEEIDRLRPIVQSRLLAASTLRERTIESERDAWEHAIASIAESSIYGGLRIVPQEGLVPLREGHGGTWEFWHTLSGERPEVDLFTDKFNLEEGDGMVLVLLPGGEFTMGSPEDESSRQSNENLKRVDLEPFFCSKFEVTQDQWERELGVNPSLYQPSSSVNSTPSQPETLLELTPLHPVESVTWDECVEYSGRVDLRLPREAEWEYACRAGSSGSYSWGPDPADLNGKENVRDASHSQIAGEETGWNDGYALHSPVGHYLANDFGLFDMHGNVSEWCQDFYMPGVLPDDPPRRRIFRGGSWYLTLRFSRSAFRQFDSPGGLNPARGVRLVRDLRP